MDNKTEYDKFDKFLNRLLIACFCLCILTCILALTGVIELPEQPELTPEERKKRDQLIDEAFFRMHHPDNMGIY